MKALLKYGLVLLLWQTVALPAATVVTNFSGGNTITLFVQSNGSLWGMGTSVFGQLGDGTSGATNRPEQIISNGVAAVACGAIHSLVLKSDGSLWTTGWNGSGQLGDGTFNSTNMPKKIVSGGVVAIAAAADHSMFVKSDGSLWAMGVNSHGELGDGTVNSTNQPELIVPTNVVAVSLGAGHSLFIKSDGSLWGMGDNSYGELGDGTFNSTNRPELIIPAGVIAITAGSFCSLFIKSDGSLWGMGANNYGQIGDGTLNNTNRPEQVVSNGVIQVVAAQTGGQTLFLKSNGSLWGMGYNTAGQLGDSNLLKKISIPSLIVSNDVSAIAVGQEHSLFLKSDGSLWGMGDMYYRQLGDGFTNAFSFIPEQIYPSPQPLLTNRVSSKTNLQFNAACPFGGKFYLLAGTNLVQPVSQWIPVATNVINNRTNNLFSATLTNAVNSGTGQQYYILQSQ